MPMPYGVLSTPAISPKRYKLQIELIPERQWGVNLRSAMSATQWGQVSREIFEAAGHRCALCGGRGRKHPVECHEVWSYDEDPDLAAGKRVQRLEGLQALCPACHRVKHLGFADKQGWLDASIKHLARVNGIGIPEARAYLDWAYAQQRRREFMKWAQDLSWFSDRYPGRLRSERIAAPMG